MEQPKVTTQNPEKRTRNFTEVSLGYSKKIASEEARRCPQCADPVCMKGCPLGINIPGFIRHLREGDVSLAYSKIKEENWLPAICGRICSAKCEAACVLTEEQAPIGIRALERYASDFGRSRVSKNDQLTQRGKKVAVVGSGPTGLTAAAQLASLGCSVTVFESLDQPGGVLRYGIPEYRIPKKVLDSEINDLKAMGVEIKTNFFIGQTASLQDLLNEGFSAVLLALGAGVPKFMDLPGANLGGVYYGEEFLMRINLTKGNLFSPGALNFFLGEKVVVIGSGNTALDCARTAIRYGRDVTMVFRGTEDDLHVRNSERDLAKEEGVVFESLVRPTEIMANGNDFVSGLKCIRMDYADSKGKGEWELVAVDGSEFMIEADTVIIAVGHRPNSIVAKLDSNLKLNRDGTIKISEKTGMSSVEGVFAAGNVVTNAGPVVGAMADGKRAAKLIDEYLKK